jgi:hypothetical protein
MEKWKEIKGFENLYLISNMGNVKSLGNGLSKNPKTKMQRIMKINSHSKGYQKIKLLKESKPYYMLVHRLVAENWIENPMNKKEVNHKDGNKSNNHIDNLEWVTSRENKIHAIQTGLFVVKRGAENKQSKKVAQLDLNGEFIKVFDCIKDIKRELGFNSFGIIKCCKKEKKYKTAYKFKWQYV